MNHICIDMYNIEIVGWNIVLQLHYDYTYRDLNGVRTRNNIRNNYINALKLNVSNFFYSKPEPFCKTT